MRVSDRFLQYVRYASLSKGCADPGEITIAKALERELCNLGLSDVRRDENAYVYGFLPATAGYEDRPAIGFFAHTDTADEHPAGAVHPVLHPDYDGGDVALTGRTLRVADFPHLKTLAGRTLITTDGTTLLGADDRAGAAEIITMLETVQAENIPHGRIAVCFTSDEERGSEGLDGIDLQAFGCDYAFTVDGGAEGELEYENFNAAGADFEIQGFNVHPGSSKDTMINAALVAMEINAMLPSAETPRDTEGYEGFYHLCDMRGDVEHAKLAYIVRDHSTERFESRLDTLRHIEKVINERWGKGTAALTITRQYRNMAEKIRPCFHIIELAKAAIRDAGLEPRVQPIRGGTDGAKLSYMGLPCPNLGTGGYAFHGPYEHCTAEGMEMAEKVLENIVRRFARQPQGADI